ncbi:MAG: bifunctional riboflavin kinase/FAD synthetase [Muribaculaceae bacterium]|nr:bifunctional riboflavin kinase/FAD synthetase [Muribaculaceae bacterium]
MNFQVPYEALTNDRKFAVTIGMFDGVHLGHQQVFDTLKHKASQLGLEYAVVTFKEHPQIVLNPNSDLRTIMNFDEKIKAIENCGIDNAIVLKFNKEIAKLGAKDFLAILHEQYNVEALIIGFNHHFGHNKNEKFEDYINFGKEIGVEVIQAEEYTGDFSPLSSSIIRRLITAGKVDDASGCLGNIFKIQGNVVHGFKNGKKIGFPTANIKPTNQLQIIPHNGVYAARIAIENGNFLNAICNIGTRPTITNSNERSIEVHIFDFDKDIYDLDATVQFIKFIRSETKFSSLEELKRHIATDCEKAKKILKNTTK